MKSMKSLPCQALCTAMVVATILSSSVATGQTPAALPDDSQVVARVNGINITKGEVRQRVEIYELAHPGLAPGESRVRRAGIAIQVFIYGVLYEQLARDLGVTVSDADVEAKYAEIRGKQGDQAFTMRLRMAGSDPANLRRDFRRALVEEKILERLGRMVVITDRDVKAQYESEKRTLFPEQVKARQIIVLTEDLARRLYRQITKEGKDFAELARSTSTEASSREQGGDLGWVLRGQGHMSPWDNIVFNMKPGAISEPFETGHGWHIVMVEEYRAVGWGRPEDMHDVLVHLITKERANREMKRSIEALKKRADLWVMDRVTLDGPDQAKSHQQVGKP